VRFRPEPPAGAIPETKEAMGGFSIASFFGLLAPKNILAQARGAPPAQGRTASAGKNPHPGVLAEVPQGAPPRPLCGKPDRGQDSAKQSIFRHEPMEEPLIKTDPQPDYRRIRPPAGGLFPRAFPLLIEYNEIREGKEKTRFGFRSK